MDPTAWMGLFTLVLLELVLGIDNLIFIAILADRLPPSQRDRARQIGLLLALGMRLGLLACISWLANLTDPLINLLGKDLSGRDLILLIGGLFLLFKATGEIHGRLEGKSHGDAHSGYKAKFWMVITQIVILDAVFSLDAVITAVGMTQHLSMMMIAVIIAIFLMIVVSKPLTKFVNAHPTIVMLCLGFLLMVGFSLIAEGLGAHIPKGYLYAAIGFSILIEAFNQFAQAKLKKRVTDSSDMRLRTADALLKLLGARKSDGNGESHEMSVLLQQAAKHDVLGPAEKELLRGVLNLTERPVSTVMTPRTDIEWLDINETDKDIHEDIIDSPRSQMIVCEDEIDSVLGLVRKEDFLVPLMKTGQAPDIRRIIREPLFIHENVPVLSLLETFKKTPTDMAIIIDEFGSIQGIVTHQDMLEAIAGEFPDHDEEQSEGEIAVQPDGSYLIDGMASIYDVRDRTGLAYEPDGTFATMAGFILHEMGHFPKMGEHLKWNDWDIEILSMDGKRISKLKMKQNGAEDGED